MNNMNYGYSSPSSLYSSPYSSTPSGVRPSRPRFSYSGATYPRPRSSASKPNPQPYNDSMVNNYSGSTNRMDSIYDSGNNFSNYSSTNDDSIYYSANESFYGRNQVNEDSYQDNYQKLSMQYPSSTYQGNNALLEEPKNGGNYQDSIPISNKLQGNPNFHPLGSFPTANTNPTNKFEANFKKNLFPQRKFGKPKRKMENKDKVRWHCDLCNLDFTSQIPLEMHLKGAKHAKKLKAKGVVPVVQPQAKATEVETEKKDLYCAICNVHTNSSLQLQTHLEGSKHKNKTKETPKPEEPEAKPEAPAVKTDFNGKSNGAVTRPLPSDFESPQPTKIAKFSCDICNVCMNSDTQLSQHLASKKHQAKVEGKPLVKAKKIKLAVQEDITEGETNETPTSLDTSSSSKDPKTVTGVQSLSTSFVQAGTL